jgi:hypothetical protein
MSTPLFTNSMFESIQDALKQDQQKKSNIYADFLQCSPGHTYTVRILPGSDLSKTFFHHYIQGWNSFSTGKYVSVLSPFTFGERDIISEERFKVLRFGSEEEKERIKAVRRTERWLVNVYVVNDPVHPENNGKVKILNYGKQIDKIIKDGTTGDGAKEFGRRIFSLGSDGVNLLIKAETQSNFTSYSNTRFSSYDTDLKLTEQQQKEIYSSVKDLSTILPLKSEDEMRKMLDEHYYCKSVDETKLPKHQEAVVELAQKVVHQEPTKVATTITDSDIDELLKDL